MTINYKDYLKLPSYQMYIDALYDKSIPFSVRARIINAYRRMKQSGLPDLHWKEPFRFPIIKEYPDVLNEEPFKTAKEKKQEKAKRRVVKTLSWRKRNHADFQENQGSPKNAKVRNSLKSVERYTSGGKGRPSRKVKSQYVAVKHTIYLKGNKYSGGQSEY